MKYIIYTLLCLMLASSAFAAGFEVKAYTGLNSTAGTGFSHGKNLIVVDASGNVYVLVKAQTSTSRSPLLFSKTWGADTLSTGAMRILAGGTLWPTSNNTNQDGNLYQIGDTVFALSGFGGAIQTTLVAKIISGDTSYNDGGAGSLVETLLVPSASVVSRQGLSYMGEGSGYVLVSDSDMTNDTTMTFQLGEITQTTSKTRRGGTSINNPAAGTFGNGQRIGFRNIANVKAGVLLTDVNNEGFGWADTNQGLTRIDTNIATGVVLANSDEYLRVAWVRDSFGVCVYQPDTTSAANPLLIFDFRLTSTTGSPTGIVRGSIDTIVTAGTFNQGNTANPAILVYGGDSVRVFWRQYNNATSRWDIKSALSTTKGATIGAASTFKSGADSVRVRDLQVTPQPYYTGSSVKYALGYRDGLSTGADTLRVWFETETFSAPPVTGSSNTIIRQSKTRTIKH